MKMPEIEWMSGPGWAAAPASRPTAPAAVPEMAGRCTRCGLCRKDCRFLQQYGLPGDIAAGFASDPETGRAAAFACSLCGLCTALCPAGLDPAQMFLALRRDAVTTGTADLADYAGLLGYERRGTSKRYSWYALPENCQTVFFPGCTLSGTRPESTRRLYKHLKGRDAAIGIVLDCCTKPSHDLGRQDYFKAMFAELCHYLVEAGVREVLVACPNCYKVFCQYSHGLRVATVYEYLAAAPPETPAPDLGITVTVHDPCVIRDETGIHEAVRTLIRARGLTIREMAHSGKQTLCCGEGGAVGCIAGDLAGQWAQRRKQEANGERILTYCAGCAGMLGRATPTDHLIDLLFEPERTLAGRARVSRAPFTYLNRLRLKRQLRRTSAGTRTRERSLSTPSAVDGRRRSRYRLPAK